MAAVFVLDRASILERLGEDEEIYGMMVDMFLGDLESNCAALDAALASGESSTIHREVHTIKGLLATFSDEAGAAHAMEVERRAKFGEIDDLAGDIAAIQDRLREVARVLRAG